MHNHSWSRKIASLAYRSESQLFKRIEIKHAPICCQALTNFMDIKTMMETNLRRWQFTFRKIC
jgi:hypothetical protein